MGRIKSTEIKYGLAKASFAEPYNYLSSAIKNE